MRIVTYFSLVLSAGLLFACNEERPGTAANPPGVVRESSAVTPPAPTPPAVSATSQSTGTLTPAGDEAGPRLVVDEFGRRMRNISKLAPREQLIESLRAQYGGLVMPSLLSRWIASPATAPGREVSSPWPDRIEVTDVGRTGDQVVVRGVVIEMTSTGTAGRTPVRITLVQRDGKWLISGFETTSSPPSHEDGPNRDAAAAVEIVKNYYAAINARDYKRAWDCWGADGAPGQTFDSFRKGFEETAAVSVVTGTPSRIGAAAGSRYIDVPVVVIAKTKNGGTQRFEGAYTLRRVVVDGAPAWQREWHLEQAKLRRTSGAGRKVRAEEATRE